ncbi:hypothetical protein CFE70_002404 [Pyrenophora teres f. teres 0-1]
MSPPLTMIHPSELEAAINVLPNGKPRKPPINLGDCELKELVQYKCNIQKPEKKGDHVCGGLSVETTAWESWKARQEGANGKS